MRKYIAEFLGTFALVFIGAGVVLVNGILGGTIGLAGVALAHGLVLMSMIYALSHISGAHFNPAVTAAMAATKRISVSDAVLYIISQLLGSAVAGLLLLMIFMSLSAQAEFPRAVIYGFPTQVPVVAGLAIEAVLTFFLVLTFFGTVVDQRAQKGFYGIAIGLVLTFGILFAGPITGGAMNPARAFGPALASGVFDTQYIYWVGPIIGALLAGLLYEYVLLEKKK